MKPQHWLATRIIAGRPRLFAGLLCGLASYPLLARFSPLTRAILMWDIGVAVFLALSALLFLSEHIDRMARDAERQEEGEWTIFGLTIAGTLFSLAAIVSAFAGISHLPAKTRGWHVALVAATLVLSWLMTHTAFTFRYAHEYYSKSAGRDEVDGGLDFPSEKRPDYLDFFYFSLVLGMTFQVSDVQITARKFRRMATLHGLLGFLFNTVILALTVNIAAGLL